MTKLRKIRKKIWDIESAFHCSVIGTCLTLSELRQLYQKSKFNLNKSLNDYELHHLFVHIADEASYPTKKLQNFLDQKYQINIRNLVNISSTEELESCWNISKENGDVAGDFWALVTHPSSSNELLDKIYADIHMLSHLSGATLRLDMETFKRLKTSHIQLQKKYNNIQTSNQKKLNDALAKIDKLKSELKNKNELQTRYNSLKYKLENSNLSQLDTLQNRLEKTNHKLKLEIELRQHTESELQQENVHYQSAINRLKESQIKCKQLTSQLNNIQSTSDSTLYTDSLTQEDNKINLCGRCILYVGGRNNLCNHFRELVEQRNGQFIHHDGGREEGTNRLNATLSKADIVLCPLNCISHTAMHTIKKHCESYTKPLTYLPRASVSAFTKALTDMAV